MDTQIEAREVDEAVAEMVAVPAPQTVAAVKTVEEWATAKGMLPQLHAAPEMRLPSADRGAFVARVAMSGLTGPRPNPKYIEFARARALRAWPESKEVTEAEFDKAVTEAATVICR